MYICICNGITEREIHSAVENGANSLADLRRELGVATQCGRCAQHARQILKESSDAGSLTLQPAQQS